MDLFIEPLLDEKYIETIIITHPFNFQGELISLNSFYLGSTEIYMAIFLGIISDQSTAGAELDELIIEEYKFRMLKLMVTRGMGSKIFMTANSAFFSVLSLIINFIFSQ